MRNILYVSTVFMGLSMASMAFAQETSPAATEAWRRGQNTVERILAERAETKFGPIDRLSDSRKERLEQLLDQAAKILATSPATFGRDRLRQLSEEERRVRADIASARVARAGAPEAPEGWLAGVASFMSPVKNRADYDRMIAQYEERLKGIARDGESVKQTFAQDLSKIGIRLRPEQIDALMGLASADDMVALQALFANMRGIVASLKESVGSEGGLEGARRLYGIHAVLLEIAMEAHEDILGRIDHDWNRRLTDIEDDTKRLKVEANTIYRSERDEALREIARSNMAAQELTLKATTLYRHRLQEQRKGVEQSLTRLRAQSRVSVNTWATAERTADLVALMRASDRAFAALAGFEVPPLQPFESKELQGEVERLTGMLRDASPGS